MFWQSKRILQSKTFASSGILLQKDKTMVVRGSEAARFALESNHEIILLAKRAASLHTTPIATCHPERSASGVKDPSILKSNKFILSAST